MWAWVVLSRGVESAQDLEQRRRHVQERARAGGEPGVAHVGGRRLQQRDVEAGRERLDERPQLVVGRETVEVDERTGQVVGLDDHVVGGLVGLAVGQALHDLAHDRRERVDEPRDGRIQAEVDPHEAGSLARRAAATWAGTLSRRDRAHCSRSDPRARAPGEGRVAGAGDGIDGGQERGAARRRPICSWRGPTRCSRPTSTMSSGPSATGSAPTVVDRLRLSEARIEAMAGGLRQVAGLPDPVGEVLDGWVRPNGLRIERVRVPLGVVAIIYENRPNVTSDAAALCLKSGNAAFLRGSSGAITSNIAIASVLREAVAKAGLPADCGRAGRRTRRHEAAVEFMRQRDYIDCLIPRGGPSLIRSILDHATVPYVIDGDGNCHVYVDAAADLDMALDIIVNAKTQRPSVCNAAETLARAPSGGRGVPAPGGRRRSTASSWSATRPPGPWSRTRPTDDDYATEFLDLKLAVRVVDSLDEAIDHITRFGTGHSEAIVTPHRSTRPTASPPRSTPPPSWSTRRPGSSTARSSASAPRSASPPRSSTPAGRWACASSPPPSTSSGAPARSAADRVGAARHAAYRRPQVSGLTGGQARR